MSYSTEQVTTLQNAPSPITYADAGEFAEQFGVSRGSVIAKVLSLELDYERKPVPAPTVRRPTKSDLVAEIAHNLNAVSTDNLTGLDKATVSALVVLLDLTS